MHGRQPDDPRGRSTQPRHPGEAQIIDLTSRLPAARIPELEPDPPSPMEWTARKVALLACAVGLASSLAGIWFAHVWQQGVAHDAALELIAELESPLTPDLRWPAQDNRRLRLIGMADHGGSSSHAFVLRPEEERMAELWLFEAALQREDPIALRSLAAYHLRQADSPRMLILARTELKTWLTRHGPAASVLNDLGVAQALSGTASEALESLEQALELEPRSPVILYNAAQVARAVGPLALEAEKDFLSRYLQQDADSPWRPAMQARFEAVISAGFDARILYGAPPLQTR